MTFDEEMGRFWKGFDKRQREWLEASYAPYQQAVKAKDAVKAQEIVCTLFTGSERKQRAALRKIGVKGVMVEYTAKGRIVIPLGDPS
jgi:hypothetical protein